ncbi:MAG: hypothetical protein WC467_01810 [Patescibacteria group bacterium]
MIEAAARRYRATMQNLIDLHYPELKNMKIYLFRYHFRYFWASAIWLIPFHVILLSPRTDTLEDDALRGLLGHELSHLSRYQEKGWFKYLIVYPFIYIFSKKGVIAEENAVDKLTIKKGLGKELFALRVVCDNDAKHARVNHRYLTTDEISQHDDQNYKW